ncbi:MAG: LuxR C-terminal-related transcriptional regulator [Planctomycetota bacterium]
MASPTHQPDSGGRMISQEDAVQLVELLARISAHDGDHTAKKRLLLDGLCRLLEATQWSWAINVFDGDKTPHHAGTLQGGFTIEQAQCLATCVNHPATHRVFAPTYEHVLTRPEPLTIRMEDHAGAEEWSKSEAAELAAAAGIGTFVSSICAVEGRGSSTVTLFRPYGDPPFTDRQRDMLHIVIRGVPWLHSAGWPEDTRIQRIAELPNSHMVLLTLLVKGYSRQQIAESQYLSVNTVNTYTRRLFEMFGVHSQPELMRRFLHGQPEEASGPASS